MLCLFLVKDCSLHPPSPALPGHFSTCQPLPGEGKKPPHKHDGFSQVQTAPGLWRMWFSVGSPSATWGFTGSAALAPTNTSPAGSNDKLHLSSSFAQHPQCPPRVILWTLSHALSKHCCPKGHQDWDGFDRDLFFSFAKVCCVVAGLGKCCPLIEGFYKWSWVCARFDLG